MPPLQAAPTTPIHQAAARAVVRRKLRPVNTLTLLPFIVLIGAMFLMTRSAKRKQSQAAQMRNEMQPGTGVRTIGGMYATVKEVSEDTVLLDAAPGVHLIFAKNSIGAVLSDDEYNRIVHGIDPDLKDDDAVVPDDASSLTGTDESAAADASGDQPIDLGKKDVDAQDDAADEPAAGEAAEPKKTDGESDAK